MAKYKVLKRFNDLNLSVLREPGEIVDYTVKRANEISNKIASQGYEGEFLERIKEDNEDSGE